MEREAAKERQRTLNNLPHLDSFFDVASSKLDEATDGASEKFSEANQESGRALDKVARAA